MLGNFILENLFGISLLTISISLALGIYVAYLLWGRCYHEVMTSEAATHRFRREAGELRALQQRLKAKLAS